MWPFKKKAAREIPDLPQRQYIFRHYSPRDTHHESGYFNTVTTVKETECTGAELDQQAIEYAQRKARDMKEDGISGEITITGVYKSTGFYAIVMLEDIENPKIFGSSMN